MCANAGCPKFDKEHYKDVMLRHLRGYGLRYKEALREVRRRTETMTIFDMVSCDCIHDGEVTRVWVLVNGVERYRLVKKG